MKLPFSVFSIPKHSAKPWWRINFSVFLALLKVLGFFLKLALGSTYSDKECKRYFLGSG